MSDSLALPRRTKFFVRMLIHLSAASTSPLNPMERNNTKAQRFFQFMIGEVKIHELRGVRKQPRTRSASQTPLLSRGGVAAPRRKCREASLTAQTGWCCSSSNKFVLVIEPTTPSAPNKDASRHFLGVASTPPLLRRGVLLAHRVRQHARRPWFIDFSATSVHD